MKKGIVLAVLAGLTLAISTVSFVPSVRAEVGEIINTWFHFKSPSGEYEVALSGPAEFTPLNPTYLPIGLQSSGIVGSVSESGAESVELAYFNDEQFVAITQSKAPADKSLPAGQEMTVNGQPATLFTGLDGTFEYGFHIPEGAHVETFGTSPVESDPYHGTIAYTEGRQLTWYVGDVRIEMLSNLSEEEMIKIAESMTPSNAREGEAPFQRSLDLPPNGKEKVIEAEEGHIIIHEIPTGSNP